MPTSPRKRVGIRGLQGRSQIERGAFLGAGEPLGGLRGQIDIGPLLGGQAQRGIGHAGPRSAGTLAARACLSRRTPKRPGADRTPADDDRGRTPASSTLALPLFREEQSRLRHRQLRLPRPLPDTSSHATGVAVNTRAGANTGQRPRQGRRPEIRQNRYSDARVSPRHEDGRRPRTRSPGYGELRAPDQAVGGSLDGNHFGPLGGSLAAQSASGDLCLASASLHQSGSMALLYSCNSRAGASPASARRHQSRTALATWLVVTASDARR